MEPIIMFGGLFCGAVILTGVLAILIFLLVNGMGGFFRTSSGWEELARRFPGPVKSTEGLERSSIRLGNVFYRLGIFIGMSPEGLYIVFKGAFQNPPILIPWRELNNPQPAILYWQPAHRLDIGNPVINHITLKDIQYQTAKFYLSSYGQRQPGCDQA